MNTGHIKMVLKISICFLARVVKGVYSAQSIILYLLKEMDSKVKETLSSYSLQLLNLY